MCGCRTIRVLPLFYCPLEFWGGSKLQRLLFQQLSKNLYIIIEYGVETCNNSVLKQIKISEVI